MAAAAAVAVARDKQASLCTLWEGAGLVPRPCFSSLPLFLRHCGVHNTKWKTVMVSTGHVCGSKKTLGGRGAGPWSMKEETGRQEGWSGDPLDTEANLVSWLSLPPPGGLCLLL